MIKFFRSIRRSLLMENKTSRYFKYAIGEILLVVIGILIALQANNWNEQRKVQEAIQNTENALVQEVQFNIKKVKRSIQNGYLLGKVLDSLKANQYIETIAKARSSFYGDFGVFDTFTFDLESENLDAWIDYEKVLPSKDKELLPLAKNVKGLILSREHWETLSTELSTTRFKEFADELPWFYNTDSSSMAKRQSYIQNDPYFRNKAIHFLNFQLNENIWYTTLFRNTALLFLWQMEGKKKGESPEDLRAFLGSLGMQPMEKLDCETLPYKSHERLGFRNSLSIWNTTNDTISITIVDPLGAILRTSSLRPKESYNNYYFDDQYLQVGDTCQEVYAPTQHGYLVIE
jgi:hypothetical protein